jgi:hypothetical protein
MKGKVKAADLEAVVNENLKLMDTLLEARKIEVSNLEATKSPEALIAYMNGDPYGNWIIGQYSHMSRENRATFIKGMNAVLPFVKNKGIFMSYLKYSVKADWCKQLDYDCWMNDFMAVSDAECILTDEGYEEIHDKYETKIQEFMSEMAPDCQEEYPDESLHCANQ